MKIKTPHSLTDRAGIVFTEPHGSAEGYLPHFFCRTAGQNRSSGAAQCGRRKNIDLHTLRFRATS